MAIPAPEERESVCSSSALFVLFGSLIGWMMPTRVGEGGSSLLLLIQKLSFSRKKKKSSQTHPEIVFYQLSGHLLPQSS